MSDILGISSDIFFDANYIKIYDGIAGSAKSSAIDKAFKDAGIKYLRATSTNKLAEDAFNRYGGIVGTIAGSLFTTEDCCFFKDIKEIEYDVENIVIDEILQVSSRVFDWILKNRKKYNIIITTDSFQMLSPAKDGILKRFADLKKEAFTVVSEPSKSLRPVNTPTESWFNRLYRQSLNSFFGKVRAEFPCIDFEKMPYSADDVYICHTKDIEEVIYKRFELFYAYDAPLIKKGNLFKKAPKNLRSYPIMPQTLVERLNPREYFQIANIATPTRYQGSEVMPGQKLYYVLTNEGVVTPRELYTVVTRCKDVASLVLVFYEPKSRDKDPLKNFRGLPIVEERPLFLTEAELAQLRSQDGYNESNGFFDCDRAALEAFAQQRREKEPGCWFNPDKTFFYSSGKEQLRLGDLNTEPDTGVKLHTLMKKDPALYQNENNLKLFYRILDLRLPTQCITYQMPRFWNGIEFQRSEFKYALDFKASYPTILKYEKLPTGNHAEIDYSWDKDKDFPFFVVKSKGPMPVGAVCTERLAEALAIFYPDVKCERFFVTGFQQGSYMGNYLWHKAFESKVPFKKMHYGYLERRHIFPLPEEGIAVRNQFNLNELLMIAIKSAQLANVLLAKEILGVNECYVNADCIYFNLDEDSLFKKCVELQKELAPYHFRIYEPHYSGDELRLIEEKKDILFATYRIKFDKKVAKSGDMLLTESKKDDILPIWE